MLRPYYADLATRTDLPAINTPALDRAQRLTRFAFGSCNHQDRSQDIWPVIGAQNPQLFLAIGDNVYGDNGWRGQADLGTFLESYRKQLGHAEFASFVGAVPTFATWDDHDFGPNDGGGTFFGREYSETLFENFWVSSNEVRSRPGIYDSFTVGPAGERVQFIMLDTRFFRSELRAAPYSPERRPLGNYLPDDSPDADMLGADQWRWLEAQLAQPADLRIVVSSIQVLTDAHRFESWSNMPRERDRLYRLLAGRSESGLLMLSGDRHSAAIYNHAPAALGEDAWEFTSSSLNLAFVSDDANEREPDPRRVTDMITQENFGMVEIDWATRQLTLRLLDDRAGALTSRVIAF